MKSLAIVGIIAASATFVAAMPATAQSLTAPNFYGTLGYTYVDANDVNLGAVTGRLGARLHPNFGVEGEAAIGVDRTSAFDAERIAARINGVMLVSLAGPKSTTATGDRIILREEG